MEVVTPQQLGPCAGIHSMNGYFAGPIYCFRADLLSLLCGGRYNSKTSLGINLAKYRYLVPAAIKTMGGRTKRNSKPHGANRNDSVAKSMVKNCTPRRNFKKR